MPSIFAGAAALLLAAGVTVRADDAAIDQAPYAELLSEHVNENGLVDYKALKANRRPLDRYVRQLGALNRSTFDDWPADRRIALLINAYNAFTLQVVIDHYPIEASWLGSLRFPNNSIRQIDGVWDEITFTLMGEDVTLEHIEHQMLRKHYDEPRIHMAINCASMGCPVLRAEPFTGEKLDEQLADQSRRFLSSRKKFRIDRDSGYIYLSPIFKWFGQDFIGVYSPGDGFKGHSKQIRAVLAFCAEYLPEREAEYLRRGDYGVAYFDYDWSLNDQQRN